MIYNENLYRLIEIKIVKDFIKLQHFKIALSGNDSGLLLYKPPYIVEFKDALIENYLEIYFSDLKSELYMEGSSALGCSLDMGLQSLELLRARDLSNDCDKEYFLSENILKIRHLYSNLEAIDKLLPLIEAKGGLASIRDGTFDPRFDFKDSVKPMWHGLKERYLSCIAQGVSSQ